jgi:hypothetical protein
MFESAPPAEVVRMRAQPVVDAFFAAVVACGRDPLFKPEIEVAAAPGATRYDHSRGAVVLVPYELLDPARRAAMDRYAAIGTLGLSGREQYIEVFNDLLVAHELGHWVQEISRRPLTRWRAEYEANRMMVALWRDHPAPPPAPSTERRLANFIAQAPGASGPMSESGGHDAESYFNTHVEQIERTPADYAWFQKLMVREAITQTPHPMFCETIHAAWPRAE